MCNTLLLIGFGVGCLVEKLFVIILIILDKIKEKLKK